MELNPLFELIGEKAQTRVALLRNKPFRLLQEGSRAGIQTLGFCPQLVLLPCHSAAFFSLGTQPLLDPVLCNL